jgi:hypothetical protein
MVGHTAGIIFLACIHNERPPDFENTCLWCATVELGLTKKKHPVTDALKTSQKWSAVKRVISEFRKLAIPYPVRTFCEGKMTVYHSRGFGSISSKTSVVGLFLPIRFIVFCECYPELTP